MTRRARKSEKLPARVYLDGMADSSRAAMAGALDAIADFFSPGATRETFAWQGVRYEDSQRLRRHLAGKYKARSVNKMLAALRGVLKTCWRIGLMSTDDYHHARDVRIVPIVEPPAGRRLALSELRKLVQSTEDKRDAALVALLYAAGLRRFEAAGLRVGDYDRAIGQITVRGKRNKVRQIMVHEGWREPIEAWIDEYGARSGDPLFPRRSRKTKKPDGHHLSLRAVTYIVEHMRKRLGLAPFTPHDMRRTLLTNLIDSGADLVVVKRIAGHESISTTAGYDRRGRAAEDAAIGRLEGLDPPDSPRR